MNKNNPSKTRPYDLLDERIVPEFHGKDIIYAEHVARYEFARQFVRGKTVLDVACGSGYGSQTLARAGAKMVFGLDKSQTAVNYAKKNFKGGKLEFLAGDAEAMNFENGFFDAVISFETIEHLKNPAAFLKEIKRVLKRRGIAVISTPNALVFPKGSKSHVKEFTPREFKAILLNYFKNIIFYYQHDVAASCIFDEMVIAKSGEEITAKLVKMGVIPAESNLYQIAVAGDEAIHDIKGVTTLFTDELLKNSALGLKIINFLHRLRTSIPIFKDI